MVTMPPMDMEVSTVALLNPRRLSGNQSLMTRVAMGTSPAWAAPKATREASMGRKEYTLADQRLNSDQSKLMRVRAHLGPRRVPSQPPGT